MVKSQASSSFASSADSSEEDSVERKHDEAIRKCINRYLMRMTVDFSQTVFNPMELQNRIGLMAKQSLSADSEIPIESLMDPLLRL